AQHRRGAGRGGPAAHYQPRGETRLGAAASPIPGYIGGGLLPRLDPKGGGGEVRFAPRYREKPHPLGDRKTEAGAQGKGDPGMSQHTLIREQLVRWTLGEPPDTPGTAPLDHLCACSACRSFARSIEETLAALPEALPLERPPQHLRHAVLQTIRNESPQDAGPQAVAEEAD